jgi:hypothetical protein
MGNALHVVLSWGGKDAEVALRLEDIIYLHCNGDAFVHQPATGFELSHSRAESKLVVHYPRLLICAQDVGSRRPDLQVLPDTCLENGPLIRP